MAKPDEKKYPGLKKAWDEYSMSISWDVLHDMKMRDYDLCYVVLAWQDGDEICIADMARAGLSQPWEMQSDGYEPLSQEQWKQLQILPHCNWFSVPTKADLEKFEHGERVNTDKKYARAFEIYDEGYRNAFGSGNSVDNWLESNSYKKYFKK